MIYSLQIALHCKILLWQVMQGFDDESGEPTTPITMESWPSHQYLKKKKLPKDYFGRYACLDLMVCLTNNFWPYDW